MKNYTIAKIIAIFCLISLGFPFLAQAQTASNFNPDFIISDEEMQSTGNWTTSDIQQFLTSKGSYLASLVVPDVSGIVKTAAEIIYDAAVTYQVNPKYLLVTLQKEQSLITDDTPTQKQLDWATGYAVCDSCSMSDPKVMKHKGFSKQVDDAAGIIRWYYDNTANSIVKKKDQTTSIDNTSVVPQSWATAFLYTYTPHLHGNENFWRIWNTWFSQIYPNGTLLKSDLTGDVWLIQNGVKRKFTNQATLLSMADPKMIITTSETDLSNYTAGTDISFPVYSILRSASGIYLLDYDTLRPFASEAVVRALGYNPQEVIEVDDTDLANYPIGDVITASTTPGSVQGVIYQITDLNNAYYLFKGNKLYPITDKNIIQTNYKDLPIEKHKLSYIKSIETADMPITFKDGTLLKPAGGSIVYVMENGKKRRLADDDTFLAMGYKRTNVVTVAQATVVSILNGEPIFLNSSLISSKNKFLGDSEAKVDDMYGSKLPAYLVAEYPSGRIISGKNIDKKLSIASLTKLVVAYEALNQNFDLTKTSVYDSKKYGSTGAGLSLKNGAKIKNTDLFNYTLVASTNNTARMLAQATGLSEANFVSAMKETLNNWGVSDTTISDVTGLDKNNQSSARNLLKIFTKIMENKNIKSALSLTKYSFKELPSKAGAASHAIANTNQLFKVTNKNYKILASKTGYTDEAGAVMLMLVESTVTKKQYTVITLGNPNYSNRFTEPNNIAKWISTGKVKIANY
ncbi:MAG: serine hydrolase [Patescibacteria group bacterium]